MAYIRKKYKFTDAANKQLRHGIAVLAGKQAARTKAMKVMKVMKKPKKMHSRTKIARGAKNWQKTVKIGGKNYDKAMIDAAKYAVKNEKNKIVSMADAKLILQAARPTKGGRSTYSTVEKATMAYIRKKYKFTDAANKQLRHGIAVLAGKQSARTKAMKAMKKWGDHTL